MASINHMPVIDKHLNCKWVVVRNIRKEKLGLDAVNKEKLIFFKEKRNYQNRIKEIVL